jgi:hypothetical protein
VTVGGFSHGKGEGIQCCQLAQNFGSFVIENTGEIYLYPYTGKLGNRNFIYEKMQNF